MFETEVVTSHRKILFHVTSTIIFIFCIQQGDVIPYQSFLLAVLQKLCKAVPFLYANVAVQQNYLILLL